MANDLPKKLGPYELLEIRGQGGMATVYRAYQSSVRRYVAVKIISGNLASDANFLARFERESSTLAALEHPHILPVIDYGNADNTAYLVMRLMDGGGLEDKLRKGPMPIAETSRLLSQIASALDY